MSVRSRAVDWLPLTLAGLLAACSTSAVQPPVGQLQAPAGWQGPAGGSDAVQAGWWRAYGDPVMSKLIERGLAGNLDIATAAARVREAAALREVQLGAAMPTLGAGIGVQRSRSLNGFGKPFDATSEQPQFQAAYEVDLWGRIGDLGRAADVSLSATQAARDAVALSVAAAIATNYINLRATDAKLVVAQNTMTSRSAALKLAQSRRASGDTSLLELAQAQSEYHAAAQLLPQLEIAKRQSEHILSVLLGAAPGAIERGNALQALLQPAVPAPGLPSALLRRRPDIASAENAVAASNLQLAAAKAQLLPAVNLTATLARVQSTALTGDPFTLWSLGGSIVAPLFEGGRLRGQVNASRSRADLALIAYEKTVLGAFAEVEDQLVALEQLQLQQAEAKGQSDALEEALRIAHNRYQAGYSSYLDEIDAQRNLFNVQQAVLQLQANRLIASVNLYRALGGGWSKQAAP